MKCSWSLLQDHEIGQRLFRNGMRKTYKILMDVFDLAINDDELNQDPRVISHSKDPDTYKFEVIFEFNKRIISVQYAFDPIDDMVQEVLKISEKVHFRHPLEAFQDNYRDATNYVMSVLEDKYGLIFTPLDLDDTDPNISDIQDDLKNTWKVVFTHDDLESTFIAVFEYTEEEPNKSSLTITEDKLHIIYLD